MPSKPLEDTPKTSKDKAETREPDEFTIILLGAIILKNGKLFNLAGPVYYPGMDEEQVVAVEKTIVGGLVDLGVKALEAKKVKQP